MDFVDLWRCGRIRCLHLIQVLRFRVLGSSFSRFGGFVFEIWGLRFRDLGVFIFDLGCFVFEFWVLRFRDSGASFSRFGCFVLRSSLSSASFSELPSALRAFIQINCSNYPCYPATLFSPCLRAICT